MSKYEFPEDVSKEPVYPKDGKGLNKFIPGVDYFYVTRVFVDLETDEIHAGLVSGLRKVPSEMVEELKRRAKRDDELTNQKTLYFRRFKSSDDAQDFIEKYNEPNIFKRTFKKVLKKPFKVY